MEDPTVNPEEENDELFEHHRIEVDVRQGPLRIDKYLTERLQNVTRNKIQFAIQEGFVKVNENPVKANYKIKPRDLIIISLPQPPRDTDIVPEKIPLQIVHEDEDIIVVDKPAGMVVHPAYQNWSGTLVNGLLYHFNNLPHAPRNKFRPGLVHRIDKGTSGLLVIAKNENAQNMLAGQFFRHSIERSYQALVWGVPKEAEGTIRVNIGRNPKDRRVMTAFPEGDAGKDAVTHYRILKDLRYLSLLECRLETGRTHQIRTHMKYLGHPLFNDSSYGGDRILKGTVFSKYKSFVENCFKILPRQALHAYSLGFIHPATGNFIKFESPLPPEFIAVLEKWENYINYN